MVSLSIPNYFINFVSEIFYRDDMNAKESYILNASTGTQKRCLSNGESLKKYLPGVTGFYTAKQRKEKLNTKLDTDVLNFKVPNYIPQPNKFEGYTNFPRPLSRSYVNKTAYFKNNVMKVPKSLITKPFLNKHNNFISNKDKNFRTNNVGTSYM
jgi:hypothetical protein